MELSNLPSFDVTMKMVNGQKVPFIKVKTETRVREDGSRDVIIHAPSLSLINKSLKNTKK